MEELLSQLNKYSNLATAVATVVLAALTAFLWFENRYLRKAGSAPDVVAYLMPNADGTGAVEFILGNIGRGPAFDVEYQFISDAADFEAHRVMLTNDKNRRPVSVLPQGDKLVAIFGIGFELYGNMGKNKIEPLEPFGVRIEYSDTFGRKHISNRTIDIRQFAGMRGIASKSHMQKITESLGGIEKHLAQMAPAPARSLEFVDATQMSDRYIQKRKANPETPTDQPPE